MPMLDCVVKEGCNSYLIGIIFTRDCMSKVDKGWARNWLCIGPIFLDHCEMIGRVYEVLMSTHALYCFMIPLLNIQ